MTKLEFVNKFFFQWFFVRLTRCTKSVDTEVVVMPDWLKAFVKNPANNAKMQWYSFQGWIVPITGWSNDFKFLGRRWFFRVTRKRLKSAPKGMSS